MIRMRGFKLLVMASVVGFGLGSCGSATQFTDIWKAPDVTEIHAKKVLAVCLTADETMRRMGEDELIRGLKNAQGVASYTLLDQNQVRDLDYARQALKEAGFDVAVTMRGVGTDVQQTYVPGNYVSAPYGSYYGSYWGYHGYAWPAVYEPGYMQSTKYVLVETCIYSIPQDKLLWSGRSQTADPSSVSALVKEVAGEARKILNSQGLVAK